MDGTRVSPNWHWIPHLNQRPRVRLIYIFVLTPFYGESHLYFPEEPTPISYVPSHCVPMSAVFHACKWEGAIHHCLKSHHIHIFLTNSLCVKLSPVSTKLPGHIYKVGLRASALWELLETKASAPLPELDKWTDGWREGWLHDWMDGFIDNINYSRQLVKQKGRLIFRNWQAISFTGVGHDRLTQKETNVMQLIDIYIRKSWWHREELSQAFDFSENVTFVAQWMNGWLARWMNEMINRWMDG